MANNDKHLDYNGLLYFWQQIKAKLSGKVDKVEGKGLSTNDYTTDEKNKLAGIAEGANKTTVEDVLTSTSKTNALSAAQGKALKDQLDNVEDSLGSLDYGDMKKSTYDADNDGKVDEAKHAESAESATSAGSAATAGDASKLGGQLPSYYAKASDIPTVPTNVSAFTNDAGYLTEHQDISSKLDKTDDGSNVTVTFTQASERNNVATGDKLSAILGKIAKFFGDLKTVAFTGKYSDLTGLPTIPTVTNDLTDELKGNYDAAYTHSQAAHAPSDAEKNTVVGFKVNGVVQAPSAERIVDIAVPTTVAQLSDAGDYAKKSDLTNVYKYKGSVDTYADLPSADLTVGDVYNVVGDKGMNYAWNGTAWDTLGEVFTIETLTNADIDAILAQ